MPFLFSDCKRDVFEFPFGTRRAELSGLPRDGEKGTIGITFRTGKIVQGFTKGKRGWKKQDMWDSGYL
jgi:hypothetical protein